MGRADVLWDFLKGQQLQGLKSVLPTLGLNIPRMVCYPVTTASILTPERCLPSVDWVKALELPNIPTHHPHLAIFV